MKFVLDASALLALLNAEPGAEFVAERLDQSEVSVVNLTEIGTRLIDAGATLADYRRAISLLDLVEVPFDRELADLAAEIRGSTRAAGLSLGDRACLALAIRSGATALTADRAWLSIKAGCVVEMIR